MTKQHDDSLLSHTHTDTPLLPAFHRSVPSRIFVCFLVHCCPQMFLRGMPHLHSKMHRLTANEKKAPVYPDDAPNFYNANEFCPLPGGPAPNRAGKSTNASVAGTARMGSSIRQESTDGFSSTGMMQQTNMNDGIVTSSFAAALPGSTSPQLQQSFRLRYYQSCEHLTTHRIWHQK